MRIQKDAVTPTEALRRVFNVPYVTTARCTSSIRCSHLVPYQIRSFQSQIAAKKQGSSRSVPPSKNADLDMATRLQQLKQEMRANVGPSRNPPPAQQSRLDMSSRSQQLRPPMRRDVGSSQNTQPSKPSSVDMASRFQPRQHMQASMFSGRDAQAFKPKIADMAGRPPQMKQQMQGNTYPGQVTQTSNVWGAAESTSSRSSPPQPQTGSQQDFVIRTVKQRYRDPRQVQQQSHMREDALPMPNQPLYYNNSPRDEPFSDFTRRVHRDDGRGDTDRPFRFHDRFRGQPATWSSQDKPTRGRKFSRGADPFPHLTYNEEIVHDMREADIQPQVIRVIRKDAPPTQPEPIHYVLQQVRQENERIERVDLDNLTADDLRLLNLEDYKLEDFRPETSGQQIGARSQTTSASDQLQSGGPDYVSKKLSPRKVARLAKIDAVKYLVQNSKLDPNHDLICKIMTVGEIRADLRKKQDLQKSQKKNRDVLKQIEINWAVEPNDLQNKLNQMETFIDKGNKVELVLAGKRSGKKKSKKASYPEAEALVAKIRQKVEEIDAADMKPMEGKLLAQINWTVHRKPKAA